MDSILTKVLFFDVYIKSLQFIKNKIEYEKREKNFFYSNFQTDVLEMAKNCTFWQKIK